MRRHATWAALGAGLAVLAGVQAPAQADAVRSCAVVAHRGAWSTTYTENGLPAMRSAIGLGADYVETDLRATRDKQLVLMHDAGVGRTSNGIGLVAGKSLRQIRRLRLDDGSRVPTVQELLATARTTGVHLLIEMKRMGDLSTYRALAREIRAFGRERVRVTSTSTSQLDTLESIAPGIPKGIVTGSLLTPEQVAPYDSVVLNATVMTLEWLEAMPYPVYAWTLNDEERWAASNATRLAGVITDAPALFIPWRTTGCA